MARPLLIFVALLWIPVFSQSTHACQCREHSTTVCARFWRSDAVFVGQVVDIKPFRRKLDNVYTYAMVHFVVKESFRGVSGSRVAVGVATNTMCDPKFKKGKRYLVFATVDDVTNRLFTGMCTGTTLAFDDDEDLQYLRKLRARQVGESISGRISRNRYEGLPGIQIEVTSSDQMFKTITDNYGDFSLTLPARGSFKVRVLVPYPVRLVDHSDDDVAVRSSNSESISTFEYNVTLEKGQCSHLELDLYGTDPRATATVAGNILTAAGQAVDKGAVSLINALDTGQDYVALLKKDGSFRFEEVSPGEYYVVLNARNEVPDEIDAPYARTYYPDTVDKREAKKIQVVEGGIIQNLVLRVGPRMMERRVTGRVVWKGGRPLEFARIEVYSGDKHVRNVFIKDDGMFNFILYGDFAYSIEASDFIYEIEGRSQRIQIPQGHSSGHKLVIQRIK